MQTDNVAPFKESIYTMTVLGAYDIWHTVNNLLLGHLIHICSGITRGRVLNGELYAQRLQKLIYL